MTTHAEEDTMDEHPNVATVNRMTQAIFDQDRDALSRIFTDDMEFHLRGPIPNAGDHVGVDGLLGVLGALFALTNGDIKLDQLFCVGTDGWAAEWERAVLGRAGKTLETYDAFIYRFEGDRIAEMWMFVGATPERASSFLT
ncbi:MAG TPA: nuclear transport factor 2 family protein [Acidimicrobiales bacterium]|nr:nuclear transport factor 2 family protein [Acidimicrobiales bacterium]